VLATRRISAEKPPRGSTRNVAYPSRVCRRIVTPDVMALGVAPSGEFNRFVIVMP
jgi:hypothetical protein